MDKKFKGNRASEWGKCGNLVFVNRELSCRSYLRINLNEFPSRSSQIVISDDAEQNL